MIFVMILMMTTIINQYIFIILLQTALTSLDGLSKFIDLGQLTSDLGGSFKYDHSKWINIRMVGQEIF